MKLHVAFQFGIKTTTVYKVANASEELTHGGAPASFNLLRGAQYFLDSLRHAIVF